MSCSTICLENVSVDFDNRFTLHNVNWQIDSDQNWVIVGPNGAGKSALAAVLAAAGQIACDHINGFPNRVGLVSFEAQAELIDEELKKDDADIMDVISRGTPVNEILSSVCTNKTLRDFLVDKFSIEHLLPRAFRKLSTGETRKVMLVRALASDPELLVLDEPFEGLDAGSSEALKEHLSSLVGSVPMVLVLNRWDEHPEFVSDLAYVENGELKSCISRDQEGGDSEYQNLYQLLHLKTTELTLPSADGVSAVPELNPEQPLVRLTDAKISYTDTQIFSGVNWTIRAGQHWQLTGSNGSGKTGLLSLITGDHPQCYTNDIWVFGFQRGSGESVWQIKQYIGYVSTALQWQYRVSTSVRNVIISGFYDSIGVYIKSTDAEREIANQWLAILGMQDRADQSFSTSSFGDQRMLLIARAMVKNPPLLILDEPCVGLDDMNRQLVLALIEKICADSQSSVIYVSHHAEDKIKGIDNYLDLNS